ncbi:MULTISPECIES: alanine--tRNA ligase [Olivibacter]|uniref:Alanine--tRNA ligase n=1 Tax=Olivibacter oleidegradans TaxID=760123 RepID=A0ABV6HJ69_9SPHI|nr:MULTISPECIES: alanine--tRNA ligase [Olivibacter]MCL4641827.1 alanine--tRNA ligase [Olivibacter sp. UJ_SKK_5.1]MDX3913352.1 alanine--tRNA ligase [Pseudosphingobacterium sp.]QEL01747.1 alanine--tRNA ligase [Olivibacter sp. LS-1]
MTSREIRQAFLFFFKSKGHEIVPSAPIVVKNDPTLMFTNAGMNQFKELFLGEAPIKYSRVVDTQRCLRVSGKHNDLEEVGIDTYHHTMFEMLGNWSFGDYFKKEAIAWSWELLTNVYKIDKDRLYVTVFEGDSEEGLPEDTEAYGYWKEHIDSTRILKGNKKDNFWEMGETGPCGPCSEIHVDCRSDEERRMIDGSTLVNADHPQVIEIWNNVFMQFNRLKDGSLQPLPAKHVDTGMGFERLVRVLQGKTSNYDTDIFQPLIQLIAKAAKVQYGENEQQDIAMRVMADHIRAISFAIADGQLPSNNKAGYVIRRILRRAVRYAYTFLNFKEPFLNTLVIPLAQQFEGVFDELYKQQDFVQKVVLEEELSFLRTLVTGIQRFESYHTDQGLVSGDFAFELYDTYGFPIDLTDLMAREKGWKVDMPGFENALNKQKERSRAATAIDTGDWVTVSEDGETHFVGYDNLATETKILKYRKVSAKGKIQYQLVLSQTPFYAEGGGQVGDTGILIHETSKETIQIVDTKKENGLIIHFSDEIPSHLEGVFFAKVAEDRRRDIQSNHSATHLLHAALKQVLGEHVNQKGSLVSEEVLRFDFSHFAKVSDEELRRVEQVVNAKIRENLALDERRNVPYNDAIDMGVTALFGEKYGDFVRVIIFDENFSKELCGGTHVQYTGNIGFFKILSEGAVAAGVRRIEAITGRRAEEIIDRQDELINELKNLLKHPKDLSAAITGLLQENSKLKKEVEKSLVEKAQQLRQVLVEKAIDINGVRFIGEQVELPNADAVKNLAFAIKKAIDNGLFLVLAADFDGKPNLTVVLSDDLVSRGLDAGKIVRELAKEIKGGGGGQPFYATAGGKDSSGLTVALEKAKSFVG